MFAKKNWRHAESLLKMDLSSPACLHSASHSEMPHGVWERRVSEHFPAYPFQLPPSTGFGRMWIEPLPHNHRSLPVAHLRLKPETEHLELMGVFQTEPTNLGGDSLRNRQGSTSEVRLWFEKAALGSLIHTGMQGARLPHAQDCCFTVSRVGLWQILLVSWNTCSSVRLGVLWTSDVFRTAVGVSGVR